MDAAREAAATGEDDSCDSKGIDYLGGPTVEHVDDDAMGWVLEEEQPQR